MAANNTFSRFLIVNGQPILIKNDVMGLNQTQSLTTDILQQAIEDVTSNDSISAVMNCNSDNRPTMDGDRNTPICINETNSGRSESYVTVLSSDQHSDDTSTIRLTLEQAAELGLHFTIDSMDQMLEINTIARKEDNDRPTSDQNDFSIPLQQSLCNQQNADLSSKLDAEMPCSLVQNVDMLNKTNENNDYLSALNSLDPAQDQQLSLVPQIINGTVTYTLQLSNQSTSSLTNSNEFFRIDNHSIVGQNSIVENASSLKLDLNSISTTTDLSFINSSVDLVSNKFSDKHVCNSKEGDNSSSQTYGLVSCDNDNVTFLSLSDVIPVGSSVSSIVSHLNNTSSQENKLAIKSESIPENASSTKSKIFVISNGGSSDSLLVKQKDGGSIIKKSRTLVSVQNETDIPASKNGPVQIKTKLFEKINICDTSNISSLVSKTPVGNSSNSNFNFVGKEVTRPSGSSSTFHRTSSNRPIDEKMDVDVHSSLINVRE